jgi:hypothetical protein
VEILHQILKDDIENLILKVGGELKYKFWIGFRLELEVKNLEYIPEFFTDVIENNEPYGMFYLAVNWYKRWLRDGLLCGKKHEKNQFTSKMKKKLGFDWVELAEKAGKTESFALMWLGDINKSRFEIANKYYSRALKMGDNDAFFALGTLKNHRCQALGNSVTASQLFQDSIFYFTRGAYKGNCNCINALCDYYIEKYHDDPQYLVILTGLFETGILHDEKHFVQKRNRFYIGKKFSVREYWALALNGFSKYCNIVDRKIYSTLSTKISI